MEEQFNASLVHIGLTCSPIRHAKQDAIQLSTEIIGIILVTNAVTNVETVMVPINPPA